MTISAIRLRSIPASPRRGELRGLVMTDYGFLFALGLALFLAVDPFEWGSERIGLTKHLPLMCALPALFFCMVGARIFPRGLTYSKTLPAFWPLIALGIIIVTGSLYARFALEFSNTFLTTGLYIWAAPMSAAMLLRSTAPDRLLRAYFIMLLLAGFVVFGGLAANYGVRPVYHELEYLFPPLAVYAAFALRKGWLRLLAILFFLATAVMFKKNTGYLTGLLVLAYLVVFIYWPAWKRYDPFRRMTRVYLLIVAVLSLAMLAAFLYMHRETYLPTGNPEYRLWTYQRAWERFLESPAWGAFFTAPGSEKFTVYDTGVSLNILPTHSDILDILANGGVLGVALWLWGMARVARMALQSGLKPEYGGHPLAPYGHALACMSLAGILTYAFNPILLQPAKSMLLWANLGFLVGISLLLNEHQQPIREFET